MMNIIIYNVNSFGGNFEYAKEIANAYQAHDNVSNVTVISPNDVNSKCPLITDTPSSKNKLVRKIHFIYRSIVNPLRLSRFLKRQQPSVFIFNDYDQISSFLWYKAFLKLKRQHIFAVILHDPDRDKFLPFKSLSTYTMEKVMDVMDVALSHGYLPDKPYYHNAVKKVVVPHGVYPPAEVDQELSAEITKQKNKPYLLGILGNIRDEKNYEFIIDALTELPDCQLLVAGSRSSGNVPVDDYKKKIAGLYLEDRVIWIERFLTEGELNAAIASCDVILLYYKTSFTSQSGILNIIASYKKKLLITDTPSALQQVSNLYRLGVLVPPNNKAAFINSVNKITSLDAHAFDKAWKNYIDNASWSKNIAIAVDAFKSVKGSDV